MPNSTANDGTTEAAELRGEVELQRSQLQRVHSELAMALRKAVELETALARASAEITQHKLDIERLKSERDDAIVRAATGAPSSLMLAAVEPSSDAKLLAASYLFDREWYLEQYQDVALAKMDAVAHYLEFGAKEGRNPSPFFDTNWYLQQYPDVRDSGCNPLIHFLRLGRAEGRHPRMTPGFSAGTAG